MLLVVLLLALAAPWVTVEPPGAGFRVKMPIVPKQTQTQTATPLGNVTTTLFMAEVDWGTYTVTCSDLPRAAVTFASGKVLSDTRDELLKDAGAALVADTDVANGKEMSYRTERLLGWSRLQLAGTRLFVADVKVARGKSKARLVDPFFASFALSP